MTPEGLDLVHSFIIVAQELSFRRSAELLNVDRSALTRRIQKLEELHGFALFERTTRDVSLTPAGRALYESSVTLLQGYAKSVDTARRISDGKTGRLRIAYMAFAATKWMPVTVARFLRENPHVDINMRYIGTQRQRVALATDEIDLGYMIGPFDHSDFHVLPVRAEPLYAVMPANHPLTRKFEIGPDDIALHELVLGDMSEWEAYRWHLNEMFSRRGVQLKIKLEASNTLALIGLVAAGLGITVCPESLAETFGGNVAIRKITHPDFHIETVLAWSRTNRTKALRQFVDIAKVVSAQR